MDPEQRQCEAELHLTWEHKGQLVLVSVLFFLFLMYHHLAYLNFKNHYL